MTQISYKNMNLTNNEKYILFNNYRPRIIWAIKRGFRKFDSIPLEIEDFEFYAWEAYLDILEKYNSRNMRKSFESCLVDAVYWKTLNVCAKYVSNKFKLVNNCMRTSSYLDEEYKLGYYNEDKTQSDIYKEIGWNHLLEQFFEKRNDKIAKSIFVFHLYGMSFIEIGKKLDISSAKSRNILNRTLHELRQVVHKEAFLD